MHIPNIIPLWQCAIYLVIFFIALFFSQRWARDNLDERSVPLMAVLAAGIFVIMTLNIPLPLGISGHVVGAAMIAIIFGAVEPAIIIFALVLLAEALAIGDGGITVIGANLLNMGIIGGFVGLYGFKALKKPLGKIPAIAIASWSAIVLSAVATALELWFAGVFPLQSGVMLMGIYHMFIGIIEAVITVVVILALESVRPDLLSWSNEDEAQSEPAKAPSGNRKRNIFIALTIVVLIGVLSPFVASGNPDGLQKSMEQLSSNVQEQNYYSPPMADYTIPGFENNPLGGVLALLLGISAVAVVAYIIARILKKRNPPEEVSE